MFGEDMPDVGNGPVFVVGQNLDQHGHSARTITLVGNLLIGDAFEFPCSLS